MSPKQKVSFINKQGKRVVFWAAKQTDRAARAGARKISAYGKKKVPYKPYKTPAQRKAAQRKATAKAKGMWARCPICHKLQAVKTTAEKNAWLVAHVKRYH